MDPEVLVVDGDAAVVVVVVDGDLIVVAVAIAVGVEFEFELELDGFPSASAHILARHCKPAVISEVMLLSAPHFDAEHWTAVFPPVSRFASIAVQTHCRSDSWVLEPASLTQEVPTLLE